MEDVEVKVVDPNTGGAKGSKPSQLGWADPLALIELGKVYGFGGTKYSPTNYRRGYKWSLSLNAMLRHIHAWMNGETKDPQSGLHPLAHAAWHCLCLISFELRNAGEDDVTWKKGRHV